MDCAKTQKLLMGYLDGELSGAESAELERRLQEDEKLRTVLEELRLVREQAAELAEREPDTDLWTGIEASIMAGSAGALDDDVVELRSVRVDRERKFSFTLGQLVAASIALVALGSGAFALVGNLAGPGGNAVADRPAAVVASGEGTVLTSTEPAPRASYAAAIQELEVRLLEDRDDLDTATVRVLEESLRKIDRAIDQAMEALDADPSSAYLNRHLTDAMARKLAILRRANALPSART
jgi:anti-sigma factor RsiW